MLPIAWYLLKVMMVSGILFSYYWIALRNKRFHQYNRFYLLASIILSWIIPLIKIQLWEESIQEPQVVSLLTVVATGDRYIAQADRFKLDWNTSTVLIVSLISTIFFAQLLIAVVRIKRLINSNPAKKWNDVSFVFTNAKGTPFSFFRYIFWNDQIDLKSPEGKQILRHELTHVHERHSIDKIFLSAMLIVSWYNPITWLIRKELNMIHEFVADQKAISDGDTHAFALMLLKTAYPAHSGILTNSFFHSPIKRRLIMLTSSKKTSFTYARRVATLPLIMFTILLFAFSIKKGKALTNTLKIKSNSTINNTTESPILDRFEQPTTDGSNYQDTSLKKKRTGPAKITVQNGTDANAREFSQDPKVTAKSANAEQLKKTLVLLDGNQMSWEEFEKLQIKPEQVKSMNVLKGEAATTNYGEKGKNGVIEVTTASTDIVKSDQQKFNQKQQKYREEQQKQAEFKRKYHEDMLKHKEEEQKQSKFISKYHEEQQAFGNSQQNYNSQALQAQDETSAEFPGGAESWRKYLERNLNANIPAKNHAPAGDYPVVLEFTVDENGNISNVSATSKNGYGTEEEAIRMIKKGPKWIPGKKNGSFVTTKVRQIITFRVNEK